MRGRKPTPTRQKILAGNPGKRPLNKREPVHVIPPNMFDEPAPELVGDTVAAAEWRRLAPMLRNARTVTEADTGALLALCQQWSRYLEANASVRNAGLVIKAPNGFPMVNPYIPIGNKALTHCIKLWAELGLTPTSRTRVSVVDDADATDPFAEFEHPLIRPH